MSLTPSRALLILMVALSFGFFPPAIRGAYADGANTTFIILLTTFMRAATMTGFCLLTRKKLLANRAELLTAASSGFIQAISIISILSSLLYLPGPVTIVLLFTSTLFLMGYMWLKNEIKIQPWMISTTILCILGITFVVDIWHTKTPDELTGFVLVAIAILATTARMYIFGKLTQRQNPAVVGAETFIFALLFLLPLALYQTPMAPHSYTGYGWALLSGISLSLGGFLMFYAISKVGAFHFSLYNKMEPVFTAIFSALLIGEILNWYQYFGMAIIIISLTSYQIWNHRKHNLEKTDPTP